MLKDKKTIKKESKTKALVDLQRQKRQDVSDDEMLANDDIMDKTPKAQDIEASDYSENDDDLEEEREIIKLAKEQAKLKKQAKLEAIDNKEDEEEKQLFLNPLLAFKNKSGKKAKIDGKTEEDSDVWSDDDKYDPKETREEKRAKKEKERKLLGKRKRAGLQGDIDDVNAFFKDGDIEVVPETDIKKAKGPDDLPDGYSSMDSDEIAETRALAKKMLRKKFRTETIDASYGRYAHDENEDIMPTWFVDDEAKHNRPNVNLTQEEIDEEKRQLREWNTRPSKKVTEAKARKKMRLVKALTKIKNKAQVIANSEIAEGTKMRQIKQLYNKEKEKHKEEKSYVVNRTHSTAMGKKSGRLVKMVDARLRADNRNKKMRKKSKGGKGGTQKKKFKKT